MLRTETEARASTCPLYEASKEAFDSHCQAAKCMAWRTAGHEGLGFCGLAHAPAQAHVLAFTDPAVIDALTGAVKKATQTSYS